MKRSFRAEKEFGLIVGVAFALMGLWWFHRGKFTTLSSIAVPVGALMMALALIYPRALVWPNRGWMKLAEGLSFVTTRIILAFVFFGVLTPIGLIKKLMGWDPLNRRAARKQSYWKPYSNRQRNPRHYEKMF